MVLYNGEDLMLPGLQWLSTIFYVVGILCFIPTVWAILKILLIAILLVAQRKR